MYRVVIVDDEPLMLEGMRLMIDWEAHGFYVCGEAKSAQEALHLIDACQPHLLITDVRMPGMLGTDLAGIVRHYHPQTILLFFSGYRDFAFAQSAIRSHAFGYLVKPIDRDEVHGMLLAVKQELDERVRQGQADGERLPILRDHVLRRIAGGDMGEETLLRAGVLLDIKRGDPCYCVLIATQEAPLSQGALLMISGCGGIPFLLSARQCGLCFKQMERDFPRLESLRQLLLKSLNLDVQVSMGRVDKGVEGFGRSLGEALDAMGVLFEPRGNLRVYRPMDDLAAGWLILAAPSALAAALDEGQNAELEEQLTRIRALAQSHKPDMFALRYMAKTVESMLLGLSPARLPAGWEQGLKPLWNTPALGREEWLESFASTLRTLARGQEEEENNSAPVQAVLDILEKEYKKPLSVNKIAEALHLNPAYLGQLILRTTGKTFRTLLQNVRIAHACRLLRQTPLTMAEIACAVGFRDADYFSRQFRASMAMSPNAYRSAAYREEGR